MAVEGVDYAWDVPNAAQLKAAGKHFACRYGGPGSDGKQLQSAELAKLKAAGIAVVANAEGAADGFRGTAAGRSWASDAWAHFKSLGMPADRPIYFSVDWDAGGGDWADIDAALRGAASVIGAARVGVYGSYNTVSHARAAGTARWFWQTYAWSGGKQPPSFVHLYQYRNDVSLAGSASLDLTRALLPDYGQWGIEGDGLMADITLDQIGAEVDKRLKAWSEIDPLSTADPQGTGRVGGWIRNMEARSSSRFAALLAAVQGIDDTADVPAIVAGVLAGLDPAAIAAAIPADIAQQVADELAARLAS